MFIRLFVGLRRVGLRNCRLGGIKVSEVDKSTAGDQVDDLSAGRSSGVEVAELDALLTEFQEAADACKYRMTQAHDEAQRHEAAMQAFKEASFRVRRRLRNLGATVPPDEGR